MNQDFLTFDQIIDDTGEKSGRLWVNIATNEPNHHLMIICRCCWAFAATAVLEYQIRNTRKTFVVLSEQEILDCNMDAMNCISGGWPDLVYKYIKARGIGSGYNYEYLSYSNECLNDRINRTSKINDHCECLFQNF